MSSLDILRLFIRSGAHRILTLNFDGQVVGAYSFERLTRLLLIPPRPSLSRLRLPTQNSTLQRLLSQIRIALHDRYHHVW